MNWVDAWGLIILPADPSGLPHCWVLDPTHLDPYGMRFRHPSGLVLDFHIGRLDEKGWKSTNHWHLNMGTEHLLPGTFIEGGDCPLLDDERPVWEKIKDAIENFNEKMEELIPDEINPPPIYPLPTPFPVPAG